MSDTPELPEDVTKLLDQLPGDDNVVPIKAAALKAVPKTEDPEELWRHAGPALHMLANLEESGEEGKIVRSVLVAQRDDGSLAVHGIGPEADDLSLIALLSLGLQQIQSEMLY